MNDERIENLIKDRYAAIAAIRTPIVESKRKPKWLFPTLSTAAAAVAFATFLVSLSPTPAQAVEKAKKALAEAVSFQVRIGTDTGRGEKFDYTIKRIGDMLIQDLDRPSVASILIVENKNESWLQPKGQSVVYRQKVDPD